MNSTVTTHPGRRSRPRLRVLRDDQEPEPRREGKPQALESSTRTVLVAGAQPTARAKMLRQLRELLPDGTPFVEACETWEVVAQASSSRLVVLTGDLGDLSARGLMRVLSRRHPLLPVIAVGGCTDEAAAHQVGAASL